MSTAPAPAPYRTWMCLVCGFVYDEAAGSPEDGSAARAKAMQKKGWSAEKVRGARKDDFEMVEG